MPAGKSTSARVRERASLIRSAAPYSNKMSVHVSACCGKPIKATEHLVFAVPKARYRACACDVGVHTVGRNFGYGNVAHDSTKRLQGAGFGVEAHTHTLFIGNILGGKSRQLHRRPPRSKFATSRNPAR